MNQPRKLRTRDAGSAAAPRRVELERAAEGIAQFALHVDRAPDLSRAVEGAAQQELGAELQGKIVELGGDHERPFALLATVDVMAFEPADQGHVAQGCTDPVRPILALGELQGARQVGVHLGELTDRQELREGHQHEVDEPPFCRLADPFDALHRALEDEQERPARRAAPGPQSGPPEIFERLLVVARTFGMEGEALELPAEIGIGRGDGSDRRAMQLPTPRSRHSFGTGLRDNGMAKADRRADRRLDDIEPLELGAVAQQCFAVLVQHLQGNFDLDFVAQNAQRLGALLCARGKTVEAGVDHRLHALRHKVDAVFNRQHDLFEHERHAVRPVENLVDDGRQRRALRPQLMDEFAHLGARKGVESQDRGGDVPSLCKRLRSSRQQQRTRGARRVLGHQPHAVDAFEVEEMQVLDHNQRRSARRQLRQGLDQGTGDLGLGQQAQLAMFGAGLGQQHGAQRAVLEMLDSSRRQAACDFAIRRRFAQRGGCQDERAHGRVRCGAAS